MKTVCKKLLCLMLVAMMLVSAVPFAFAADGDALSVDVYVHEDGADMGCAGQLTVDGTVALTQSLAETMVRMTDRKFLGWENNSGEDVTNGELKPGEWLENALNEGYYLIVNVASTVCKHTETTTTYTNTCGEDGYAIVKCKACGEELDRDPAAATGKHNFVGASCTDCDATREAIGSVTFHYMTSALNWTEETVYVYEKAQEITPPAAADDIRGFAFLGWSSVRNGAVDLVEGDSIAWNSGTSEHYWGTYDDDADDNLVHVTVKVAYYVNGKLNKTVPLLTSDDFPKNEDNNQMFRWLYKDGFDEINNALFANGDNVNYMWNEVFYLNNKGTDKVESDMMDDGNKIVYVVLNSKDYIEANVQLYVHKSQSSTVYDIIDMDGYTAGDKVTRGDVIDLLKEEKYSYSSLSYLYTQTEWENLLNGDNADGDKEVIIKHNGTTKIHVIVKGASQSNNADSSNPKTGDYITVAATTMVLAAAALVSVLELKKRKMI